MKFGVQSFLFAAFVLSASARPGILSRIGLKRGVDLPTEPATPSASSLPNISNLEHHSEKVTQFTNKMGVPLNNARLKLAEKPRFYTSYGADVKKDLLSARENAVKARDYAVKAQEIAMALGYDGHAQHSAGQAQYLQKVVNMCDKHLKKCR